MQVTPSIRKRNQSVRQMCNPYWNFRVEELRVLQPEIGVISCFPVGVEVPQSDGDWLLLQVTTDNLTRNADIFPRRVGSESILELGSVYDL